jgi:phosphatidate cytidylyltransferase
MTGTRVLTALVLIPLVLAVVLLTPTWVVALAVAFITILALREYFALGDAIGHRAYRLWTISSALLFILQCWRSSRAFAYLTLSMRSQLEPLVFPNPQQTQSARFMILMSPAALIFVFILGLTVLTLFTRRPLVEALSSAGISSSALLLVAFPFSYAVRLHGLPGYGPRLLLFALAVTWAADTTAYFVGRAIGKHPLAPHISPKKTWEGSLGGILGSLLIGGAANFFIPIAIPHLLAMAALGNIAGQMGDLAESAYKRSAGVKDSGTLLPGHGGVLDRIDAQILCIPVVWYYLVLVNPAK